MTTTTLPSRNAEWGFFGTIRHDTDAELACSFRGKLTDVKP